mgnify:CR=1 FL=1
MARRGKKKQKKKSHPLRKPDEFFCQGPIRMSRYGNAIEMNRNFTGEQQEIMIKELAMAVWVHFIAQNTNWFLSLKTELALIKTMSNLARTEDTEQMYGIIRVSILLEEIKTA